MKRAFLAGLLLVPALCGAMQLELTRSELCDLSHRVVVGEVSDIETRWTEGDTGGIERIARVVVSDTVKGEKAEAVEIVLPGGQIGDIGHWVEDVPRLMINGRYLLFVAPAMDGRPHVIGGDAGAVRLTDPGARVGETLEQAVASVEVCRAK